MGMVYGKAAFNAFLEILPIGILLSSKEKGSSSERSFPQNILFCTIAFAETKSPTASREQKLSLAELRRATSCLETVLKSSEWRFPLIFQGFSGYSTKIAPPFNHKNGGTLSTHGRGKCGIYNAQKVFGLIILHLRIDVHSCLAVFMPRKILNCLWINASIQKIGNVGMP